MPTLDPKCWVTLADLKEHLDIDATDTSKDSFLINVLNAAWQAAVNYIGQDLNATDYTEYQDGDGSDSILVDQYPIISIYSVYDDTGRLFDPTNSPSIVFDATDYTFYSVPGKVRLLSGLVFQTGVRNIQIRYRAGYTTIPYDAARAVILIAAWYAQRAGTEGKTAETLGGKTVQYDNYSIPLSIRQLLLPYKKFSS